MARLLVNKRHLIISLVHIPVFFIGLVMVGLMFFNLFFFHDTPGPIIPSFWGYRFFIIMVISYPVVYVIGLLLSKFFHWVFIYLAMVNFLIISSCFIYLFLFQPLWIKIQTIIKNTKIINNAPRDFICKNNGFVSLEKTRDESYTLITYYDPDFINNPGKFYIANIGSIGNRGQFISLNTLQKKVTPNIKEIILNCKNNQGKNLFDLYPSIIIE